MTDYIELHSRSAFSFLEGASHPEALAAVCAQFNMPAMALLDRDGVYGAARFHIAAEKLKIKAHIGAEVAVKGVRYPLLCESRTGYQNLCRMITRYKLRAGTKTEVSHAHESDLAEFASGLVCLTGDEHGPLATALNGGGMESGRAELEKLICAFGRENVYVELQRHFNREQESRNQAAVTLAREFNLPVLATNGVCYATPAEREIMDAFTCIRNHTRLETAGKLLALNGERYVRSPQQMAQLFADIPEAIANTVELSQRLEFKLDDLGYEFPRYPVPEGHTMMSFLRERTMAGAQNRYRPLHERARRQIERELTLIEKLKLEGYFLIVWDLIRYCGQQDILVQGRGSAANSAVCYALGITAVDPVGMDLLFERFLSEERGEWPDIDLDLPSGDEREKVIQYVYQRYGKLGAAMTANVITYRGRSAAREMGKILGFENETLDRLTRVAGAWEWKDPNDTIERQFRDAGFDLHHPRIARFMDLCIRVRDLPRHLGQHSGGMVICQGQLDSVVPLEHASMPGRVVVQWDKDDCADLGIVKVDLLGLGMMAVLKDSIDLIRDHYGEEVSLAHLPPDDVETYKTIRRADTVGMFQIESRAQMASLPRNNPEKFYDLVVQVALIRPGPIVGHMVNPYMKRRAGKEAVTYPHPSLEPVLERTLGVPLFQEQLLRMAMLCANFTGGEAEELRRALGSRRSMMRMVAIEEKLRKGMTANNIDPKTQDTIVEFINSFALYGFPESHAASFALIAYASAYLKQHYLAAFTAALLNNQPMGFYHPASIVKDAQRHGLKIKPVDVMVSDWNCTLESVASSQLPVASEKPCLRMGLSYVRGLKESVAKELLAARTMRPFASIDELTFRVPSLSKRDLTMLAQVGALNNIGRTEEHKLHRRHAIWQVERAAVPSGPLLETLPEENAVSPLAQMDTEERLVADYHGTGVTVGPHPMAYRRTEMQRMRIVRAIDLSRHRNGTKIRVAGCVIARQRPGTAHGFIFLSLEDETGIANVIIKPDVYDQDRMTILNERFLLVEGVMQHIDNVINVRAETVRALNVTAAEIRSHDFH